MYKKLLLFLFCGITFGGCVGVLDQRIVAEFTDQNFHQEIKVSEFKKKLREQKNNYSLEILNDPVGGMAVKKRILNDFIEEKILLHYVEKKKTALTPEEEKNFSDKLHSGYLESELKKTLDEKKMSLKDWEENQKQKVIIQKFIHQEMKELIEITDKELLDYYQKHPSEFKESDSVHCRQIVTSKKEKAKKILSLLKKGENFSLLAKQYSESPDAIKEGDLGEVTPRNSPPIFVQACFTLARGQTSEVIESEYGFHIFKVIDKKPGRKLKFDDVKAQIRESLYEQKIQERFRQWMAQVYRNTPVTIDESILEKISWNDL